LKVQKTLLFKFLGNNMDNKNIHNRLKDKNLRDFVAKSLEENDVYTSVENLEKELKECKEKLEKAKIRQALYLIIEKYGWEELDCSDEVFYDSKTYFPFIGTKKEYKQVFGIDVE
jgi:hypothetical protein